MLSGMSHRLTEDDVYERWFIPAGTAVMDNTWCAIYPDGTILTPGSASRRPVFCDESVYPDPESFYPDRFLKDGQIGPNVRDPEQLMFGWGRRHVILFFFHLHPSFPRVTQILQDLSWKALGATARILDDCPHSRISKSWKIRYLNI